eukprot:TRINITY_DN53341_c0_g1_i2.p1 TRINITY_DN53341_c0_g1~~TRINITY_DN53341_c0_g1_i2.p1  ORF type:complete len:113 (-),score=8.74 TRINITY_DN53341_c0_g1_i2:69-359(-)
MCFCPHSMDVWIVSHVSVLILWTCGLSATCLSSFYGRVDCQPCVSVLSRVPGLLGMSLSSGVWTCGLSAMCLSLSSVIVEAWIVYTVVHDWTVKTC